MQPLMVLQCLSESGQQSRQWSVGRDREQPKTTSQRKMKTLSNTIN